MTRVHVNCVSVQERERKAWRAGRCSSCRKWPPPVRHHLLPFSSVVRQRGSDERRAKAANHWEEMSGGVGLKEMKRRTGWMEQPEKRFGEPRDVRSLIVYSLTSETPSHVLSFSPRNPSTSFSSTTHLPLPPQPQLAHNCSAQPIR